jgi:hypothetical protein|nr:MAG TPA: hypothetical protein [Caudoviricetes sp.]
MNFIEKRNETINTYLDYQNLKVYLIKFILKNSKNEFNTKNFEEILKKINLDDISEVEKIILKIRTAYIYIEYENKSGIFDWRILSNF